MCDNAAIRRHLITFAAMSVLSPLSTFSCNYIRSVAFEEVAKVMLNESIQVSFPQEVISI